jgi:hypothetical protein
MPPERSLGAANGDGAGFEDADRFVFGAEPVRKRWMGRPLAETEGGSNSRACWPTPSFAASACRVATAIPSCSCRGSSRAIRRSL